MMRPRDKDIIKNLERFSCMSRDQIANIHFKDLKYPVSAANSVLKRLVLHKQIEVSDRFSPYVYFPSATKQKKDSQKIPHSLKIVDVYIELRQYEEPTYLVVEPRYTKDQKYADPDLLVIFKGAPFFIEVQNSRYSNKLFEKKIEYYDRLYLSKEVEKDVWQPKDKKYFPSLLIISDTRYNVSSNHYPIFQAPSIKSFMERVLPEPKPEPKKPVIETKGGIVFKMK